MLHNLVSIEDNERISRLTHIVNEFIEFICHKDNPLFDAGSTDLEHRIAACCTDQLVVKWITKGDRKELKEISTYLSKNPEQRDLLRAVFQHDAHYYDHIEDVGFAFEFFQLDEEVKKLIGAWMVQFYKLLEGDGLPMYIMGDKATLNLGKYIAIWEEKNPNLKVCPACDGKLPDRLKQRRLSDLDHFLPKSLYPLLALHPRNLVPICTECNRWVKKDRDPLVHEGVFSLGHSFHPYSYPAAADVIIVTCYRSLNNANELQVKIEDSVLSGNSVRVMSLNNLWGLEERWKGRIEDAVKSLFNKDLEGWMYLLKRFDPSGIDIRAELAEMVKSQRDRVVIGEMQDGIIYRTYLSFILSNPEELDAILAKVTHSTE